MKKQNKTEYLHLRVTPEQKTQLKKLAALAGVPLTGFLLGLALGDKIGEKIEQMVLNGYPEDQLPDQLAN